MKKCKAPGCGARFETSQPFRTWCSPECGLTIAKAKQMKEQTKAKTEEKRADRKKLAALKTRSDYIKEAQRAFNQYVRLRDNGRSCISCSTTLQLGGTGGGFDAGHFRSVGSAPHLRFDERNVHGQCKRCNMYLSGNVASYRLGLIDRAGPELVAALESDQTPGKWSIEELQQIIASYKEKAKSLKNSC